MWRINAASEKYCRETAHLDPHRTINNAKRRESVRAYIIIGARALKRSIETVCDNGMQLDAWCEWAVAK